MTTVLLLAALFCGDAVDLVRKPDGTFVQGEAARLGIAGDDGVWFDLATARKLHALNASVPIVTKKIHDLEESGRLATSEAINLRVALSDSRSQAIVLQGQLERAVAAAQKERARADAWWRSPPFWMSVGVVAAFAGLYALKED